MVTYANVHMALEGMRVSALAAVHGSPLQEDDVDEKTGTEAPRVLVLGPENSGKTSVCKILTNYAVRMGQNWTPMLVNVDPSEVHMRGCSTPVFSSSIAYTGSLLLAHREGGLSQGRSRRHLSLRQSRRPRRPLRWARWRPLLRTTSRRTPFSRCRIGTVMRRCGGIRCSWTGSSGTSERTSETSTRATLKVSLPLES